jgi:hypothetical protein
LKDDSEWEPYDPSWLVELAGRYASEYPWLGEAFSRCLRAKPESQFYTHFVDPAGEEWEFETTLTLKCPKEGEIVIDILKGNQVGGIEFLSKLIESS